MKRSSYLTSAIDIMMRNKNTMKKGFFLNICKQPIMTMNIVVFIQKNVWLKSAINNVLNDLLSGGLIDHVVSQYIDEKYLKMVEQNAEKQKLSLEKFSAIFYVLICGLVVSTFVFIIEITVKKFFDSLIFEFKCSIKENK